MSKVLVRFKKLGHFQYSRITFSVVLDFATTQSTIKSNSRNALKQNAIWQFSFTIKQLLMEMPIFGTNFPYLRFIDRY